jgi:predicted HicB family RNase H-like nuclease
MANTMKYRGYTARIDFDDDDNIFTGQLLGMAESIVFHGASVEELRADFEFAVDHYLQECARSGRTPEKPAAGRVLLRLSAELHATALVAAAAEGKSLNQWLCDAVVRATQLQAV